MKILALSFLFLFCTISVASCAQEEELAVSPVEEMEETAIASVEASIKDKELVDAYLAVDSVSVSSFDTTPDWAPPPEPRAVVDGSLLTRWSSGYEDNQWIHFDFGKPKVLNKIAVHWEAAYAVDYDILVSSDDENWDTLLSLKGQDGGIDKIEFTPVEARFVKLLAQNRVNPDWGVSIWEFLCFGPGDKNPEDRCLSAVYPQLVNKLDAGETQKTELRLEKPQPSPGRLSLDEFQKGAVYTSWGTTELATEASDQTLRHLKELGVGHLSIMIVWKQDTIKEDVIAPDSKDTPDDKALVHIINKAHSLGIKVMLKPHVDVRDGTWRADIIPSEEWFDSYKKYMLHYSRLAAQYNVEAFSVGTELVNATSLEWQGHWEDIIEEIKAIFPGQLVYGANWNEYDSVGFWDSVDFIGISAYFPLSSTNDPTKEELVASWEGNVAEIEAWLKKEEFMDKPVIFTEIGYSSADGTNTKPWQVFSKLSDEFIDQEEQADCLEAMLTVCSQKPWFKGFYWWNYFPQKRWSPLGYAIRGKRAEEVLGNWLDRL